ncbi:MAG: hypothetical protein FWB93_05175 [Oscillospiraceae bacterium]|nr:hypothetical protein [Oscillospiraceae bacterium]
MRVRILPNNERPFGNELVKYKKMGNVTQVMHSQKRNTICPILKLDRKTYVYIETGEMKNFCHNESRADDLNSVRVSMRKLRDYFNTNLTDVSKAKLVTVTYGQPDDKPMTDTVKLYNDVRKFIAKARRSFGHFEYIYVVEPQGCGAWHCHIIMIFPKKAPFIPNEVMAEMWGHGYTKTTEIKDASNVGAYLSVYFTDVELNEYVNAGNDTPCENSIKTVSVEDESGNMVEKKFVKGARLHMYPPGINIYRASKNIKKPVVERITAAEAESRVAGQKLTFERTIYIWDDNTGFDNTINYQYYNNHTSEEKLYEKPKSKYTPNNKYRNSPARVLRTPRNRQQRD